MDFDLGARFGVERIQFFPRNAHPDFLAPGFPFQNDYMRAFELLLNDGSEETQEANQPVLTTYRLTPENEDPIVELNIPPQYVRHIRLKSQTTVGFEIAEFRVFGTGFVPRADYVSNVFDFGEELALWGNIRWEEEFVGTERFSRLSTSSRSGWDDTPLVLPEKAEVKMCPGGQMRSLPHQRARNFPWTISPTCRRRWQSTTLWD